MIWSGDLLAARRAASGPYKVHSGPVTVTFSDISFGTSTSMCLDLVSWVQEVHNAAIMMVARA